MTLYTIIKNRDNYSNYCSGYLMGSSNSDFEIFITNDKEVAIKKGVDWTVAGEQLDNKYLNSDHDNYYATEVYVLINGWGGSQLDNFITDSTSNYTYSLYEEERKEIIEEIQKQSDLEVLALIGKKVREKELQKEKDKDKRENQERQELQRLKNKYEINN